jgi:hypothetical protein
MRLYQERGGGEMVGSLSSAAIDEYKIAKSRGERAKKLFDFDVDTKKTMTDIIKALKQEDLHAADPKQPSGKTDFYKACWAAISMESFSDKETEADKAAFIDDLWKTAVLSRQAQSGVPCW